MSDASDALNAAMRRADERIHAMSEFQQSFVPFGPDQQKRIWEDTIEAGVQARNRIQRLQDELLVSPQPRPLPQPAPARARAVDVRAGSMQHGAS